MVKQILKQSVGLDVSKDRVSACFSQWEEVGQIRVVSRGDFLLTAKGLSRLATWTEGLSRAGVPLHLVMEATGVYYEQLAWFLHARNYRVSVLLPNHSSAFGRSLGFKSKTDAIDAQKLAQMALERQLPQWQPPSDTWLKIKRLCRERAEFLNEMTAFKNRLHAKKHAYAPEKSGLERTKESIRFLQKQIKKVEADIRKTLAQDPLTSQRLQKVCSIPGVGPLTAAAIVAETNGFCLFKNKAQLVSYAGYDVVENTSGTSLKNPGKISKKGNGHLRKALYFPALVAVKRSPLFKEIYDRVFDKTRIKMKAYVAVQRKLLILIYTLYKNNVPFQPNFQSAKTPPKTNPVTNPLAMNQNRQEPSSCLL
jgi:transposase